MNYLYKSLFMVLILCGMVFGQLSFSEKAINFNNVSTNKSAKAQIYLKNCGLKEQQIVSAKNYNPIFSVKMDNSNIPAGDSVRVTVFVKHGYNISVKDILEIKLQSEQTIILPMQASFYYDEKNKTYSIIKTDKSTKNGNG
ncbi:MAG: hypothetical protein KAR38_07010 [Calditrichia bacterium]|nr:hypothetical protein [Calditrichia bacterium]